MVLSHKCSCGPCLLFLRNIYIHSVLECNHYKALGLSASATQAEIKSAYYELSKKHHPDKNQGSEKSTEKFRDISAAYEVLGNEKLRKQYDREQLCMRNEERETFRSRDRRDYNDELERMYYERRKYSPRRYYYRKTKYYDFDAWYKAHYSDYLNQKYYRYNNYAAGNSKMYQDPYYKASQEQPFRKVTHLKLFLICVLMISANIVYHLLKGARYRSVNNHGDLNERL